MPSMPKDVVAMSTAADAPDAKGVAPASVTVAEDFAARAGPLPRYGTVDPEVAKEFIGKYPDEARRYGIQGTVRLRIIVDTEGRVTDAKVLHGPGYGLNEAAKENILKFQFKPGIKDGEVVSTTMIYNFVFMLDP